MCSSGMPFVTCLVSSLVTCHEDLTLQKELRQAATGLMSLLCGTAKKMRLKCEDSLYPLMKLLRRNSDNIIEDTKTELVIAVRNRLISKCRKCYVLIERCLHFLLTMLYILYIARCRCCSHLLLITHNTSTEAVTARIAKALGNRKFPVYPHSEP